MANAAKSKGKLILDFAKKHFGPRGGALDAHHLRLKSYYTAKNTFAEELPSTTRHFSIVDHNGHTWYPSPHVTETTRTAKVGVYHPPQELGPGYVGFKPYAKPDGTTGQHFVGYKKEFPELK
ncbi:MAG: hypothetical protein JNM52_08680 [Betaproteobacteria bacterium]|nr:hypothetical protein [Betaproteobacteria bacterium]